MQRTPSRIIGCLTKPSSMKKHLLSLTQLQASNISWRHMASRGSKDPTRPTKAVDEKPRSRSLIVTPSTPGAPQETKPRRIIREDNMWRDPERMDIRWLRANDPRRYRPDFAQTEPPSLRKQFMRSPDERTRDAIGRDWEQSLQIAENTRRQTYLAREKRKMEEQDELDDKMDLLRKKSFKERQRVEPLNKEK